MRQAVVIGGLMTAVLAIAAPAFAQFQPPRHRSERPQRGLFGSGVSNTEQSLVLNVSFGAGYDNDLLGQATGGSAPLGPRGTGQYGFASGSLGYSVARDRISASANVGGTAQYYPDMETSEMHSFGAGLQASWQIAERTSLSASTQFSIQPSNLRNFYGRPFDSETPPESSDTLNYAISGSTFPDWRTSVNLNQRLTERLSGSVGYAFYAVDYGGPQSNYSSQTLNGRLSYQITKSLSAHGGYGTTKTAYRDPAQDSPYDGRSIDAGVDFGQAVSLTRRTSLSFGAGVSGVGYNGEVSYLATGQVSLTHELGRSWTSTIGAQRSVDFFQTFGAPVISTSVSGGVSGSLNRRISVGAHGGWSTGDVGVATTVPKFDTWTAGGSMRVALSRSAGLSVSYTFFDYVFDDNGVPPPFGTQPEMRNQSVRATFDWMLPLYTVARRANVTR